MSISKAAAEWNGTLKAGSGKMKPDHASDVAFTMGTRFEGQTGSNPEEMIGAALAGCFSMALSANLEKAGITPESIRTSASVHLEKGAAGFDITRIDLVTEARAIGTADDATFSRVADETKKGCPVSKALRAEITLDAKLVR